MPPLHTDVSIEFLLAPVILFSDKWQWLLYFIVIENAYLIHVQNFSMLACSFGFVASVCQLIVKLSYFTIIQQLYTVSQLK